MHVLYFHQHFSIPSGSTAGRSYAFARALIRKGHQVTMICGQYSGSSTGLEGDFKKNIRRGIVDDINIIEISIPYSNKMSFPKRIWQFLKFALISARLALTEQYDIVFATSTPLTIGIPAIIGKFLRRKPMVFEVRDLWPELPRAMGVITNPIILWLMSILEWLSYHAADHIIALSPGMVKGIQKRNIPKNRITMIPNGCDLDIFNPNPSSNRNSVLPKQIKDDDFVAIFSGAHGVANGLNSVIETAEILKKREQTHIKLLLVGDGMEKRDLVVAAQKHELDNIVFMDFISKHKLAELLRHIDIGLMLLKNVEAFYYGTSPNKFFDYLAAGKPILINYPGWMAEISKNHDIGYQVSPDDPEAFADILQKASKDGDLAEKGKRARQLGETTFDRNIFAKDFIQVLEEAAEKKVNL